MLPEKRVWLLPEEGNLYKITFIKDKISYILLTFSYLSCYNGYVKKGG